MRGVSSVHSRSSAASRLLLISIVQCRTICGGHMCLIIIRCSSMCTDFTECCISFSRKVCSMQCGRHGFQHFMFLFLEVEAWNPALLTDKSAVFFPWCETLLSGKYFAFASQLLCDVWIRQNAVCRWITFTKQCWVLPHTGNDSTGKEEQLTLVSALSTQNNWWRQQSWKQHISFCPEKPNKPEIVPYVWLSDGKHWMNIITRCINTKCSQYDAPVWF